MKRDVHSKISTDVQITCPFVYTSEEVEIELEDDDEQPERCSFQVNRVQESLFKCWSKYAKKIKYFLILLCTIGYFVYFAAALQYKFGDEGSVRLIIITSLVLLKFMPTFMRNIGWEIGILLKPVTDIIHKYSSKINLFLLGTIYLTVLVVIVVDLVVYSADVYNLVSFCGIVVYALLMFTLSTKPSKIKWKLVLWGFGLQFAFSLMIMRWTLGYMIFKWFGDRIYDVIEFINSGCLHVFGSSYRDHLFAMQVMSFVIFISSLITILFYFGAMEWIICKLARIMQSSMGTTAGESIIAAGNIFIGQSEAPLLIRPILTFMTDSEIHAMMSCGFATIAGGSLAAYVLFGIPPNHLLSASFMSAPAALSIAKILYPETKKSFTTAMNVKQLMPKSTDRSLFDAAASGATFAIPLVANIAANAIAFLSILEATNAAFVWLGERAGFKQPLSFQLLCSYVLWPFVLVMGVPFKDCKKVAELIGIKIFITDFVAYELLSQLIRNQKILDEHVMNNGSWSWHGMDVILSHLNGTQTKLHDGVIEDRSMVISTYALCGFSSICSVGVQIGAISAMIPGRRTAVAKMAMRAMIAGNVACFTTACVAGLFYGTGK